MPSSGGLASTGSKDSPSLQAKGGQSAGSEGEAGMRRRAQGSSRRRQRKWAKDSSWRHRQPGACLRPVAVVNFLSGMFSCVGTGTEWVGRWHPR